MLSRRSFLTKVGLGAGAVGLGLSGIKSIKAFGRDHTQINHEAVFSPTHSLDRYDAVVAVTFPFSLVCFPLATDDLLKIATDTGWRHGLKIGDPPTSMGYLCYVWATKQETINDFLREAVEKYPTCNRVRMDFRTYAINYYWSATGKWEFYSAEEVVHIP